MNALAVIPLLLIITITIARRKHDYHPNGLSHVSRVCEKDYYICLANGIVLHEYVLLLCTVNTISFSLCVQAHKHSLGECVACI